MEYKAKLIKNKSIGKVVYIVEGERREQTLLNHIFTKVLDYTLIQVKKKDVPCLKYISKTDDNSSIIVISAIDSNIKHVASEKGQRYLDRVYRTIFEKFGLDISNCATFYIFDRDYQSNTDGCCRDLISMLKNSRDNGFETNGILLLNYPCVEAYIKSCIDNTVNCTVESSRNMKISVSSGLYQIDKIQQQAVIKACVNMLLTIEDLAQLPWREEYLDNFEKISMSLFEKQEENWKSKECRILSLLSISMLDLGLIEIEACDNQQ